jgi:hypothetical protein
VATPDDLAGADVAIAQMWRSIDWTGRHEVDVREDFVTPLLPHLGYARGTVNDIVREEQFRLTHPFLMIGRDKIQIDYAPHVRLKRYFVIETKSPQDEVDHKVLLQALFYAMHPEVFARYVCLTNGRLLEVYRVGSDPFDTPVISLEQTTVTGDDVGRLREVIGAAHVAATLRAEIMETARETFHAEVDEAAVARFESDVRQMLYESKRVVKANAKALTAQAWKEEFDANNRARKEASFDQLLMMCDVPTNGQGVFGLEIAHRIGEAPAEERRAMLDEMARQWRSRVHGVFRVQCLLATLTLLERHVELGQPSDYSSTLEAAVDELGNGARTYYAHSPLSHALCHLDNAIIRVMYKVERKLGIETLSKALEAQRATMAAEDRLKDTRSVGASVLLQTNAFVFFVWRAFRLASSVDNADLLRWQLEALEESLDALPSGKYPGGDGDITSFGYYGRGFDILHMGSWEWLHRNKDVVKSSQLDPEIKAFAALSHEQALKAIPLSEGIANGGCDRATLLGRPSQADTS